MSGFNAENLPSVGNFKTKPNETLAFSYQILNTDGTPYLEPNLDDVIVSVYTDKFSETPRKVYDFSSGISHASGTNIINFSLKVEDATLPIGNYFWTIAHKRGPYIRPQGQPAFDTEVKFAGDFIVSRDCKNECDITQMIQVPTFANGWIGTGASQVFDDTTSLYRTGKLNIGGDETALPFNENYTTQVLGNTFQSGIAVKADGFRTNISSNYSLSETGIWLDVINGEDDLDPVSYLGSTDSIGNRFKTFKAAVDWINRYENGQIRLNIQNADINNPIVVSEGLNITNKNDVTIVPFPLVITNKVYFQLNSTLFITNSRVKFNVCNITINGLKALGCNVSVLWLSNTDITLDSGILQGIDITGNSSCFIDNRFTFTFSANNQVMFHSAGNYGANIFFQSHTIAPVINSGVFTGLSLTTAGYFINVYFNQITLANIPANVTLANTLCYFGGSPAFRVQQWETAHFNYALNLGTSKPLRFTGLNSASSNGAYVSRKPLYVNELGEVIVG